MFIWLNKMASPYIVDHTRWHIIYIYIYTPLTSKRHVVLPIQALTSCMDIEPLIWCFFRNHESYVISSKLMIWVLNLYEHIICRGALYHNRWRLMLRKYVWKCAEKFVKLSELQLDDQMKTSPFVFNGQSFVTGKSFCPTQESEFPCFVDFPDIEHL